MWKQVAIYGALLGAGSVALQWLDYQRLARTHLADIVLFLFAAAFLALGLWLGARLFGAPPPPRPAGNPAAIETLGISPSELLVLQKLAAGRSNKEIAQELDISPNTVKTHVARLYEKLEVQRRTAAIHKARELGIVP